MVDERESEREYWNRLAKRYDTSLGPLNRPMIRAVQLAAESASGADRILEVAAGTGLFTTKLAVSANKVIATDYSQAMVEQLKQNIDEAGLTNVQCEQPKWLILYLSTIPSKYAYKYITIVS